ncbi:MFT2-Corn MFT-like protein [Chytriomyces hyalinus]|nr:MFT2-Corn MFT-like protein [Chytriomyces hyalinus]
MRLLSLRTYVTVSATKRLRPLPAVAASDNSKARVFEYAAPPLGTVQAYDEAVALLEKEQQRLAQEIASLENGAASKSEDAETSAAKNESRIKKLKVALGLTQLDKHWEFNAGRVDFDALHKDPNSIEALTFESLKARRFETVLTPKIVKLADVHNLFVDAFPGKTRNLLKPAVNLEVNFQNTAWEACYGQPVPPNWALYSPKVTINTHSDKPKKYTLVLMDLDRQSLSSQSIHEWCHWLITDIPVTNRLTIEPGSSPYLVPSTLDTANLTDASFHPSPPSAEPKLPGKVVLPYIPPHPANSNPRKTHRYLLTIFEQPEGKSLDFSIEAIRTEAIKNQMSSNQSRAAWEKDFLGEKEEAMHFVERGTFSTWGFATQHELTVAGYAFFTAGWNLHTPDIFTRLGIHEPVFGAFPQNPTDQVHKVNQATTNAVNLLGDSLLSSLSLSQIQQLNRGTVPVVPRFKLPTRASIKADAMKTVWAERIAAKAAAATAAISGKPAKGGKKATGKSAARPVSAIKLTPKMPRLTTVGSVAVVKSKQTDVAGGSMVGEVTKSVFEKRGRYHNV